MHVTLLKGAVRCIFSRNSRTLAGSAWTRFERSPGDDRRGASRGAGRKWAPGASQSCGASVTLRGFYPQPGIRLTARLGCSWGASGIALITPKASEAGGGSKFKKLSALSPCLRQRAGKARLCAALDRRQVSIGYPVVMRSSILLATLSQISANSSNSCLIRGSSASSASFRYFRASSRR